MASVVDGRRPDDQSYVTNRSLQLGLLPALLVLASLAVPTVAAASTKCADADLMPAAGNTLALSNATLCLLNEERTSRGLKPLSSNSKLRRAAQTHSLQMVRSRFFDHVSPAGSTLLSRVRRSTTYLSGARNWALGENIAWGCGDYATPAGTVEGWMQSAGHRKNILNRKFRHIGIGVALGAPEDSGTGMPAATYTTDFGARS
jgi:uncharacterized protein YkwD